MNLALDGDGYILTFGECEELPLGIWTDLVKWRANYVCEECGKTETALLSHHIKWQSKGGESTLKNGVCLCTGCHGIKHRGRRKVVEEIDLLSLEIGAVDGKQMLEEKCGPYQLWKNTIDNYGVVEIVENAYKVIQSCTVSRSVARRMFEELVTNIP